MNKTVNINTNFQSIFFFRDANKKVLSKYKITNDKIKLSKESEKQ